MMEFQNAPVSLRACQEYDVSTLIHLLHDVFSDIGITEADLKDKNVVIKPNLVAKKSPDAAATTHPVFLEAVIMKLREYHPASITIAESPGGPYTEMALKSIYRGCGIYETVQKFDDVTLNYDVSFKEVHYPEGVVTKVFNMIKPIMEADVIIDLCKLKTHSLTTMSCAVKNFFGVVPGIQKFEIHARFPRIEDFSAYIVDLCSCVCKNHQVIAIADGIMGMEGNGPTGGSPCPMGLVLTSRNPFLLDVVAAEMIGCSENAPIVAEAAKRGLAPEKMNDSISVIGNVVVKTGTIKVKMPDSKRKTILKRLPDIWGGKFAELFQPRPAIVNNKCRGCGECERSCPVKTISMIETKKGKKAKINPDACIKCFCCQELCPFVAIKTKSNPIIKILH